MTRIVCIGNRLAPPDDAGPRVYDRLRALTLPDGVEAIDGGLAGLDLLALLDGAGAVVLVDAVRGFGPADAVVVIDASEAVEQVPDVHDHAAGLPYLLRAAQVACEAPPAVTIVGLGPEVGAAEIDAAARLAVDLAGGAT